MSTPADPPTPAVIDEAAGGPYGLRNADSASGWQPYIKRGRTPSGAEDAFAHRCTSLRDRILRFERVQVRSPKAAPSDNVSSSESVSQPKKAAPPKKDASPDQGEKTGLGDEAAKADQGGDAKKTVGASVEEAGPFDEVHIGIRGSFQAGLVQAGGAASLDALNRQLDDIDRNFVIEHAVSRYQNRVQRTLQIGVFFTASMVLLVVLAKLHWSKIMGFFISDCTLLKSMTEDGSALATFTAYAFVILGVLLGRIITLFMDFGRELKSFADYDEAYRMISSPGLDASIDVLIGFVACLCFVTGAIVISIGQPEISDTAALSTLNVDDSWPIAMVFGVFIGLVRVNFLKRLSRTAATSVG